MNGVVTIAFLMSVSFAIAFLIFEYSQQIIHLAILLIFGAFVSFIVRSFNPYCLQLQVASRHLDHSPITFLSFGIGNNLKRNLFYIKTLYKKTNNNYGR